MKIEIEYSEVENLRDQIKALHKEKIELTRELQLLSKDNLEKESLRLSYFLLDSYLTCIFKKLGFDQKESSVRVDGNLEHWLGKSWWNSERLSFNIGADISQKFKQAFISLGIITKTHE